MNIVLKLSLVLIVFAVIACESKQKEIEQLKSEAIAIHDEVMPKMDKIMSLKKSLREELDSVSSDESTAIHGLLISLENADKSMMNWMRNYDPKMEGMSDDEKIAYLKDQKASIQEVSEQMKSSISEAESYLNELEDH